MAGEEGRSSTTNVTSAEQLVFPQLVLTSSPTALTLNHIFIKRGALTSKVLHTQKKISFELLLSTHCFAWKSWLVGLQSPAWCKTPYGAERHSHCSVQTASAAALKIKSHLLIFKCQPLESAV